MNKEEYLQYRDGTASEKAKRAKQVLKAYMLIDKLDYMARKCDGYYRKPTAKLRPHILKKKYNWYFHHVEKRYRLIEEIKAKYLLEYNKGSNNHGNDTTSCVKQKENVRQTN